MHLLRLAILVLIPLTGWLAWGAYQSMTPPLYKVCEAVLLRRFAAPATYRRIRVTEENHQMTLDEYKADRIAHYTTLDMMPADGSLPDSLKLDLQLMTAGSKAVPILYRLIMEYDINNLMGVPLRKMSECTSVGLPLAGVLGEMTVKIDGTTATRWLIENMQPN